MSDIYFKLQKTGVKSFDTKSHAILCCTAQVKYISQVKSFSFRQLNEDHIYGRNCAKISTYLLQKEET